MLTWLLTLAHTHTHTYRVRDKIQAPYEAIALRTRQLERLEVATHLLRQLLRYLQLARRLRASLAAGDADLANAASGLHEIGALPTLRVRSCGRPAILMPAQMRPAGTEVLLQEKALARLPPVAADRHWLDEARTAIHKRAVQLFQDGLGNMEVRNWDPRSLQAPAGEGPCCG